MELIPHSLNDNANYISHIQDLMIGRSIFSRIDSMWGSHSVDNTQLPKFYSRFWCPGSTAIDAFSMNCMGWWCELVGPTIHLTSQVLRHAEFCSIMGSLVVHALKSAPLWPLICPPSTFYSWLHGCAFPFNQPYSSLGRVVTVSVMPWPQTLLFYVDFTTIFLDFAQKILQELVLYVLDEHAPLSYYCILFHM